MKIFRAPVVYHTMLFHSLHKTPELSGNDPHVSEICRPAVLSIFQVTFFFSINGPPFSFIPRDPQEITTYYYEMQIKVKNDKSIYKNHFAT